MTQRDNRMMSAVSIRNIPKMPAPLAPLHFCTPTALARRLREEMEMSA